jgi:hypothetical protein
MSSLIKVKMLFNKVLIHTFGISVVGMAIGYVMDDRGGRSLSPGRVKNFLFSTSSRPDLGSTQPPIK